MACSWSAARCFFDRTGWPTLAIVQRKILACGRSTVAAGALWARRRERVSFVVALILWREPPNVREGRLCAQRGHRHRGAAADQIIHPEPWAHYERENAHVQAHRHTAAHGHDLLSALGSRAAREEGRAHHAHVRREACAVHAVARLADLACIHLWEPAEHIATAQTKRRQRLGKLRADPAT